MSRLLHTGLLSGARLVLNTKKAGRTFDLSHWVFTNSSNISQEFSGICTQFSRRCVAWRRAITVENLWLTSRSRVNESADITHRDFAAVYTGVKPTWSGLPRLATHKYNGECLSSSVDRTMQGAAPLVKNQPLWGRAVETACSAFGHARTQARGRHPGASVPRFHALE